jgi:hypothetical protein
MGPTTCRSSARRPSSSASRSIPCANSAPPRSNPPPESILPASQSLPPSPPVLDDTHASGQLPQVLRHPPTSDDPKKTERPESIPRGSTITPPATRPCTQISPGARGTTAPTATTNPHTTTHLDAGNGAPVFTGDLLPSNHAAYSLDPFALRTALPPSPVSRYAHDYYGSSATPRRQRRTVRLPRTHQPGFGGHRRDAPTFTHTPVGRVGAQLYPGDIAARYRNTARPRPPERVPDRRDGPHRERGPSVPTAHSRQFRGWRRVSGLQPLVSVSLRLSALLADPARWRRTVPSSSRAACRPTPHPRRRCRPPASPDRYGGRGRGLTPRPVIGRLVPQSGLRRGGALAT